MFYLNILCEIYSEYIRLLEGKQQIGNSWYLQSIFSDYSILLSYALSSMI